MEAVMSDAQWTIIEQLMARYMRFIEAKLGTGNYPGYRGEEQIRNEKELLDYFPANTAYGDDGSFEANDVSLDLVKVWLLLLQKDYEGNIPKILAYLEAKKYGWGVHKWKGAGDREYEAFAYKFSGKCDNLQPGCREKLKWELLNQKNEEAISIQKELLESVNKIFFDEKYEEYGQISIIIFSYCLASLFKSVLTASTSPLYLQIACGRNTLMYELISEIVTICDINLGIHRECCNRTNLWECGNDRHRIIYPTSAEKTIKHLVSFKDTPIVVEGYGEIRAYQSLIREISNRNNNRIHFDTDSTLPIFLCPEIKVYSKNFFNMDLSDVQISKEYLDIVKDNSQNLTLTLYILIKDYSRFLSLETVDNDKRVGSDKETFLKEIKKSISDSTVYSIKVQKYTQNIGALKFFFTEYIRVLHFAMYCHKYTGDVETTPGIIETIEKINHERQISLNDLMGKGVNLLVNIHKKYIHLPESPIDIEIKRPTYEKHIPEKYILNKNKCIENKARKYAAELIQIYKSFKVTLSVNKVTVVGERYIFDVTVPPGTRRDDIFKNAEDVRSVMKVEYLKTVKDCLTNTIVISKNQPTKYGLATILDSDEFKNSASEIPFAIGYDTIGEMFIADLAKFTHIFIGGATRSGKSTALHNMIMSIISSKCPNDVNLLIFDFGFTFLRQFDGLPHLSHSVIDDMNVGVNVIKKLEREFEKRRKLYKTDSNAFNKHRIYSVYSRF
jgi:hypothetical protein